MPVGFACLFKVDTRNYNKKILKSNLLSIKKLVIAISGPFVNLIFIAIFIYFKQDSVLIYINILIFIFNMLPIYPLDGGRILKYILCVFFGRQKSLFFTNIVSNIIAIIMTILVLYLTIAFGNISYVFVIIYIWIVLIKENKMYKIRRNMYKILENDIAIKED